MSFNVTMTLTVVNFFCESPLKHCSSLQTLNLESNHICADGAKALADGLKHCSSLQTLNLSYNIGGDGAKALADGLKHCSSLQTLILLRNIIGADGKGPR